MSHLFSHIWEYSIETKRIDDRQSFTAPAKKKRWSLRTLGISSSSVIKASTRASGGYTPFTLEQESRRLCRNAELFLCRREENPSTPRIFCSESAVSLSHLVH